MAHTFSVQFPDGMDIKSGIEQVKSGVEAVGGKCQSDGTKGSFEVKGVVGAFMIVGRVANITISKKPWVVSYAYVETAIRGYFKPA